MKDLSTENKILNAADRIFTQKGYAGTRVRDIATEAGVNLALINYYHKSKENLFAIVMRNKVKQLFGALLPYITNESTSLEEKFEHIVQEFINVISIDRNIPIFVFSEFQKEDGKFVELIPSEEIKNSSLIHQIREQQPGKNPMHYVMNLLSLTLYPYIVTPMIIKAGLLSEKEASSILKERIKLIPEWIKQNLNS